jgi:hypothetical protein
VIATDGVTAEHDPARGGTICTTMSAVSRCYPVTSLSVIKPSKQSRRVADQVAIASRMAARCSGTCPSLNASV